MRGISGVPMVTGVRIGKVEPASINENNMISISTPDSGEISYTGGLVWMVPFRQIQFALISRSKFINVLKQAVSKEKWKDIRQSHSGRRIK